MLFLLAKNQSQLAREANKESIPNKKNTVVTITELTDIYNKTYFIIIIRVPSSFSEIYTFIQSPGNKSSILSGHSMKQSAPLKK